LFSWFVILKWFLTPFLPANSAEGGVRVLDRFYTEGIITYGQDDGTMTAEHNVLIQLDNKHYATGCFQRYVDKFARPAQWAPWRWDISRYVPVP